MPMNKITNRKKLSMKKNNEIKINYCTNSMTYIFVCIYFYQF